MQYFSEIFKMKNHLADQGDGFDTRRIPSEGLIARVNFHQYPSGGGLPSGAHRSQWSARTNSDASGWLRNLAAILNRVVFLPAKNWAVKSFYVDSYTDPGDLIVLSPAIPHGVDPIDPGATINWQSHCGRWIVLPLFVWSDYPHPDNIKPVEVKEQCAPKYP